MNMLCKVIWLVLIGITASKETEGEAHSNPDDSSSIHRTTSLRGLKDDKVKETPGQIQPKILGGSSAGNKYPWYVRFDLFRKDTLTGQVTWGGINTCGGCLVRSTLGRIHERLHVFVAHSLFLF